jgi:hypothetical protein
MSYLEPDLLGGESNFAEQLMGDVANRHPRRTVTREDNAKFSVTTEDGTVYVVTVEDVTA